MYVHHPVPLLYSSLGYVIYLDHVDHMDQEETMRGQTADRRWFVPKDVDQHVDRMRTMKLLPDLSSVEREAGPEATTSLDLLRSVYQDPTLPLATRMRAAALALPFEFPKLSVTASVKGRGMANAIEAAYRKVHAPQTQKLIAAEREREGSG